MNNVYVPRPGMVPVRDGQDNNVTQPSYSVQNPQASAGAAAGGTTGTYGMGTTAKRKKERTEKLSTYGLYTLVYAIFTAFCLYKNARGITFPFFALSTIVYADLCLRRMEGKWQKRDMWYPIAIVLLGVSVFLTEDKQMTGLAKWTIFILIGVYSLHILYDETEWKFMRYIQAMVQLIGGSIENIPSAYTDSMIFFKKRKEERAHDNAVAEAPLSEEANGSITDGEVQAPVRKKKESKLIYVGIGILVSIPLVIVIVSLLCKADAVFKEAVDRIIELIDLENIVGVLLTIIAAFTIAYAYIRYLDERSIRIDDKEHHVYEPVLAITVTSIITVIYLFFCGIQVVYLTFGNNLKLPEGYTYAKYAHEGFYELLVVCILNLIIVLVASYFFGESTALKVILTVICACTYIMMASSAYRMCMYVGEYDLTRLRVYVLYGLLVLAILMIGVIAYIYRESFPLFRYGIAVMTVAVIILVYSHPTALIASYNIRQMTDKHGLVDIRHLRELGTDAIPVILKNFDELYEYELAHDTDGRINDYDYDEDDYYYTKRSQMGRFYDDYFGKNADEEDYDCPLYDMSFRSFNLSKFLARRAYEATEDKYSTEGNYWKDMKDNYIKENKYKGESI